MVNAAGVAGGGPMHLIEDDEWARVIAVNLTGTALVCKHALAAMVEQRSGSIVNIASIEGLEGTEGGSAYNASKGGVVLLTKNLAIDYGPLGIRSNCVCPGLIDTPLSRSIYDEPESGPVPRGLDPRHPPRPARTARRDRRPAPPSSPRPTPRSSTDTRWWPTAATPPAIASGSASSSD